MRRECAYRISDPAAGLKKALLMFDTISASE
jgi:hypothetical protein